MKKGWEIKKLGEVCEIVNGGTPDTTVPEFWDGHNLWITPKDMGKLEDIYVDDTLRKITEEGLKNSSAKILPTNSIILSSRAPIGHLAINTKPLATNQGCKGLVPKKNVSFLYLYYFLSKSVDLLNSLGTGATFKELSGSKLGTIEIPLPPLPEQQLIVAILDEAFAAIAKAKANAQQNLQNAKELFESYLQGVFENKSLTPDSTDLNDGHDLKSKKKSSNHVNPKNQGSDNGEVWEEKTLGDNNLVEIIDGDRGKNYPTQKDFLDDGFCLFMNTKNVRPSGFSFKTTMFINEAKDEAMGKGKLKRNDVVMTTRGTIGNIGIYNEKIEFDNIRINSGMLIFRPNQNRLTSNYLFEIFRSGLFKEQIKKHVSGAAQPQLPIKTLVNFTFPVPKSLKTQQAIVQKLDALSFETKKLEALYQQKINDLEELKKSVLQKAFSGELKTEKMLSHV